MRQSFAVAVQEAQRQWEAKAQPAEFAEFVRLRELAGEDLKLTKGGWIKDKESPTCQLCTGTFHIPGKIVYVYMLLSQHHSG